MSVPPLRLGDNFDSYISGEVIIHPSAVLAPGVILEAAPNSKIIIGSGVCIGMGSILKVDEGTLEVEAGANLGAGFLMVGKGKIGANACIGSATTVFNCSVEPGLVVAPGSVLGDTSRQISDFATTTEQTKQPKPSTSDFTSGEEDKQTSRQADAGESSVNFSASSSTQERQQSAEGNSATAPTHNGADSSKSSTQDSQEPTTESTISIGTHIYGQGSIQRLLVTLFPHRQSLNQTLSDDQSE